MSFLVITATEMNHLSVYAIGFVSPDRHLSLYTGYLPFLEFINFGNDRCACSDQNVSVNNHVAPDHCINILSFLDLIALSNKILSGFNINPG